MSIVVNGKRITYDSTFDTSETLKNRIAAEFETLPQYLIFPDDFPEKKEYNIENIYDKIIFMAHDEKQVPFIQLQKELDNVKVNLNYETDVWPIWTLEKVEFSVKDVPEDFKSQVSGTVLDIILREWHDIIRPEKEVDMGAFWQTQLDLYNKIKERIFNLGQKEQEYLNIIRKLTEEKDIESTSFFEKRKSVRITLGPKRPILDVFNNIILTDIVPFASCGSYFKILKQFTLPKEWKLDDSSEDIILKINCKDNNVPEYIDVFVRVQNDKVICETVLVTDTKYYITEEVFQNIIIKSLQYNTLEKIEIVKTQGVFYFPNTFINIYVLSDLIMNDEQFSLLLNSDESLKATKKKTDEKQPWLYIHYESPLGHVASSITQKIAMVNDPEIKDRGFKIGSDYIRVSVKGKNVSCIQSFKKTLSKLFSVYQTKKNNIIAFYKKYIPTFDERRKIADVAEVKGKFPFKKGYTRKCQKFRQPIEITSENKETVYNLLMEDSKEDIKTFTFKDLKRGVDRVYACGVQKDENGKLIKTQYKILDTIASSGEEVPCCFDTKKKRRRAHAVSEQQNIIKTGKILEFKKFGNLPEPLELLFGRLENNSDIEYNRIGATNSKDSPYSFVNAIILALNSELNVNEVQEKVDETLRKFVASENLIPLTKQCRYDATIPQIKKDITEGKSYFDPRLYVQLLEHYFKCYIYLFNDDGLIIPRNREGYYQYVNNYTRSVFVYENIGTEFSAGAFPQCEVIGRWNKKSKEKTMDINFSTNNRVRKSIETMFNTRNEFYVSSKLISRLVFPKINVLSQFIDCYGKTRRINIDFKKNRLTLLTSPIPPLNVFLEEEQMVIIRSDIKVVLDFLNSNGLAIESQCVEEKQLVQINSVMGNGIKISIPIDYEEPLTSVKYSVNQYKDAESALEKYNKNKRVARYLRCYAMWLFSNYIIDREMNDVEIDNFISTNFRLSDPVTYNSIPKNKFSLEDSVLIKDKRLRVSGEISNRLRYMLKLACLRNEKGVREYKTNQTIPDYYIDITDLEIRPEQILLHGKHTVQMWNNNKDLKTMLYDSPQFELQTPYFFLNDLVSVKVCIAQNAQTLNSAIQIANEWVTKHKNIREGTNQNLNIDYSVYIYYSTDNIKKYKVVNGTSIDYEIKVLAYKIADKDCFTALLEM